MTSNPVTPVEASSARSAADGGLWGEAPEPGVARAIEYLEAGQLGSALSLLESLDQSSSAVIELLGVAHFRNEQYAQAVSYLRQVTALPGANGELVRLLARAEANVASDVARPVPTPVYLDASNVPMRPEPFSNTPDPTIAEERVSLRARARIGKVFSAPIRVLLSALTESFGKQPPTVVPWTNWYEHGFVRSMLMLAHRRARLNSEQLFAAYPASAGTAFFSDAQRRSRGLLGARSADGSYNDLRDPMAGAAFTRFGYNTDPNQAQCETGERLLTPNPRLVSRVLLARDRGFQPIPFLNLIAAPWIQFMTHDWVSYGDPADSEPYAIALEEDDPVRRTLHQTHLLVRPTQTDPTRRLGDSPVSHLNEVTSWWDGSQLYGSDAKTSHALRSHRSGKLLVDPNTGNLPVLSDGVESTGFRRNWWLGLSLLHSLFAQEHNAICELLLLRYPGFSDQKLFDTARLINVAVMAKIHTVEWTPAVLPNRSLNAAMDANWYGLLTNLFRPKDERRALAQINVPDPILGGIVGNATGDHGVPYSLTREFLSVYRLHSLLPDFIELFTLEGSQTAVRRLSLAETRQAAAHCITDHTPMDELFFSFGRQHPGQLQLNNYPDTLRNLSIPRAGFYDLAAVDILRDRERGVPRYNQLRRLLRLAPVHAFEDITTDPESLARLKRVYASVEDIDLLVGNLAEQHRPKGFGFGETLFEIFILNASRRLEADRFFTDCYREEYYTAEGLKWVDDASLKRVLLRHYPRLTRSSLMNVENAFEPWDDDPLDPTRHPLRKFDRALRGADQRQQKDRERALAHSTTGRMTARF